MSADLYGLGCAAAAILRRQFLSEVTLHDPVVINGKTRCLAVQYRVDGLQNVSDAPGTVVVKCFSEDDAARGFSDWASERFLSKLPALHDIAPRFFGGDIASHIFVRSDLCGSTSLWQLLAHGDAAAVTAALQSAVSYLARLHAATLGLENAFVVLRQSLPHAEGVCRHSEAFRLRKGRAHLDAWFNALGCQKPRGFDECIGNIADVYEEPGPFLSFTYGDATPNNFYFSGERVRPLGFEYGGFRHVLYDLSGWNILCPFPPEIAAEMLRAYRQQLGPFCPVVLDDGLFAPAWAALCAYRAVSVLRMLGTDLVRENRPWVHETWTGRHAVLAAVLRLRVAADGVNGCVPLADGSARLADSMRQAWPEFSGEAGMTPPWPTLTNPR